ncbi:VPLPA-CTERM sorting domain-containing protein [Roseibium aestuarii]|uniref:VPLPA-CTERM sorting domain-containing protein n=1 Tax=Roseibium aestuarii TaxID=2600299 RepID=A0ABW4JRZ4_9HYPH|nr:VPLPA-CTERM sorting domain-containing protein [Roseibium aestuarii]
MRVLNSLKKLAAAAVLGVAVLGAAGSVEAAPISGAINIQGNVNNPTSLTGVDFASNAFVLGAQGDFTSALFLPVSMTDIDFSNLGQVWSVAGFNFALTSLITAPVLNNANGINFVARGLITKAGYDDTYGVFSFSSNAVGSLASFSSTTAVPLPAGLLLIGTGVAGLGLMGRRKAKAGKDLVAA